MEQGEAAKDYLKASKDVKNGQYDLCKGFLAQVELKSSDNVFEIGCGTGEYAAYLAKDILKGGQVTACDPSKTRITVAQETFGNLENLTYIHASGSDALEGKLGVYDVVYSSAVLHWMSDEELEKTIQNSFLAMKNGAVAAHLYGYSHPVNFDKFAEYFSEEQKKEYYTMHNPVSHEKSVSLFEKCGFEIISTKQSMREILFETAGEYIAWVNATLFGKFPYKDIYEEFGDKIGLETNAVGQVVENLPAYTMLAKKP
eukprot:Seg1044.7 transcript_id=Seg1044.7/GoldUCD/mRNA.D3Y31 product="putative methyltransferase 235L" protein_id=Seg1044.7/GoldUCD/D3Y31